MSTASATPSAAPIQTDPDILGGQPFIAGTRLSVSLIQSLKAVGWSRADMLDIYPYLTDAELDAALEYKLS